MIETLLPEQVLYMTMVEMGMNIRPGTMQTLKEAIEDNNIYFFNKDGDTLGFVTWFLDGDTLEVNNLCIYSSPVKLFCLRKILHERYPHLKGVRWFDDKRRKPFEVLFGRNLAYGLK